MRKLLITYVTLFILILVLFEICSQVIVLDSSIEESKYSLSINDRTVDYECELACNKLRLLKCDEGKDIVFPDGGIATCEKFCREMINVGIKLNAACVSTITECSQIEKNCIVGIERNVDPTVKFR